MKKKEGSNEKKKILLFLILLFLIVIIILFLVKSFGLIDNRLLIPTGNVDIFDIKFNFNGKCNCGCDDNDNNIDSDKKCKSSNGGSATQDNATYNEKNESELYVYDDDTVFSTNTRLNIFTQKSYHVANDKIAPASKNSYQFIIRNNNSDNVKYNLEMIETNKYNINMKFRLKKNGVYVAGNNEKYLTASELNQYNINIVSDNYDVYILDWKWFESSNDTEVGTNINASYKLDLKITASVY